MTPRHRDYVAMPTLCWSNISLLDESLAISSELGMRHLMGRVLSRREY